MKAKQVAMESIRDKDRWYLIQLRGTFVFRAAGVLTTLIYTPLAVGSLTKEEYGVWSTLLAMMSWLVFFDLGIGNGLRNKVAQIIAVGQKGHAATFVSSAYSIVGIIAFAVLLCGLAVSNTIPWIRVFNSSVISEDVLRTTVQLAMTAVTVNFWLSLVYPLLAAMQRSTIAAFGQFCSNVALLVIFFLSTLLTTVNIEVLAFAFLLSIVSSNILLTLWFFREYPFLLPRLNFDWSQGRPLLNVGLQFLIIQLAFLVLFATDKFLIAHLFSVEKVTEYDIIIKLFSLAILLHGIISAPLWSAYTDAFFGGNIAWILNMLRKQFYVFILFIVLVVVLATFSSQVIYIWIGPSVTVSKSLAWAVAAFTLISLWNNIFATFINGIGALRVQLITAIIGMTVNVPLAYTMVKIFNFGVEGIVIANTLCLGIAAVALPIHVSRLVQTKTNAT